MRSAKEEPYFPYAAKPICYLLVMPDGNVRQIQHTKGELAEAYAAASEGKAVLYAVWPGEWRSDLFVIDDLELFADKLGIKR